MICVGLTGNIGSGKTTVAHCFQCLKIPVYNADQRARRVYENPVMLEKVIQYFGKQILLANGSLNRKALADIVFANKKKLEWLNNIIHPAVKTDFENWCDKQNAPYIIHEAAILFETGFNKLFDFNVLVVAPLEMAVERVMRRDKVQREQALARMQHQWPQEQKIPLADFIIKNDEKNMVIDQVLTIHHKLLQNI